MAKVTPMMEQYLSIKEQAKDAFLFFRLGDFYEMFYDDAIAAAKELEITLTGRGNGAEERIPMCGVPYHAADHYIQRLIEKGYKVAICEQVEDAANTKGVVRREIVRIVTPGTVMEGKLLDDKSNHYLVCLAQIAGSDANALAACDLSTGELVITSAPLEQSWIIDELNVYMPMEMIGHDVLLRAAEPLTKAWNHSVLLTRWTHPNVELARKQFGEEAWACLGDERQQVLALLMGYLQETQKRSLSQLTAIRTYNLGQYLVLDPFTRRNLELTETVRERAKRGSLLWLLDRTETSMGARQLRRWIDKPLMNRRTIEERLEAVDTLYHHLIWREELREQLSSVYDLERLVGRIAFGTANGRDLMALESSLSRVPLLKQLCEETSSQTLRNRVKDLDVCEDIREWIARAIVDDPPVSVRDGGLIKPGYDDYLDKLREASGSGKRWIAELERKEKEMTGVKSLKIGYNKVFGYYIEVTKANLSALPEGRYERKQTLANAERFVTPELKEKEALILEAEDKMLGLEYERFTELRQRIGNEICRLQRLAEIVAEIDVYQSLATVSAAQRYVRPQFTDQVDMHIEAGRHPVVEAVMHGGGFMANDTDLSEADAVMLLITGPNMAGKSTYMRQVALISIMAQIGCFVPADKAVMPLVDRIFTRIGAADDVIGGQSTFMVEMMDIQVMTTKATRRSLVIIDELGRGTSTSEGMSIAQAVVEFVHDRIGCKALVSTHFHELAHVAAQLPRLKNVCMAVQESGNQVNFLRKLIPGVASTSYGIYCARLAGLPAPIITRAYDLLQQYGALAETECSTLKALQHVSNDNHVEQLSLFGWEQAAATISPPQATDALEPVAATLHNREELQARGELIQFLQEVDVMCMTPLEAMKQLHHLMKRAREMMRD